MVKQWWILQIGWYAFVCIVSGTASLAQPVSTPPHIELDYRQEQLPQSTVHILTIPATSRWIVSAAASDGLQPLAEFARQEQAIAVINGGFFDPVNGLTTSYVIHQQQLVANPQDNERLVGNPDLAPVLNTILNRSEFRRYRCNGAIAYDIARHQHPVPPDCEIEEAVGGGPQLLPKIESVAEGFVSYSHNEIDRDAIGAFTPNARTAIGITSDGSVVWVVVTRKPQSSGSTGMTLQSLAEYLQGLGVVKALNLDGGSSSSMFYDGHFIPGTADDNYPQGRPVKSVLTVTTTAAR